jgi:glycosidase
MSMAFTFDHVRLDFGPDGRWSHGSFDLSELKAAMSYWQEGLGDQGWNAIFLGNHDEPRIVSRFGNDGVYRTESAKLLATLLTTLQGTPYVLQGDELGMTNYPFESLDEVRDVDTLKNVRIAREKGRFADEAEVLDLVRSRSRDNARTPMQWSTEENAGFTDGEPWIPVNPNYEAVNVEVERDDYDSVWHYYRQLIDLRHDSDLLVYGDYDLLLPEHEELWVYTRSLDDQQALVTLNMSDTSTTFEPPEALAGVDAELVVANYDDVEDVDSVESVDLQPWEARVYELD